MNSRWQVGLIRLWRRYPTTGLTNMDQRRIYIVFAVLLSGVLGLGGGAAAKNAMPGARSCLKCHPEVEKQLHEKTTHQPFKAMACTSCHNPHAARYDKLIKEQIGDLCKGCHEKDKALQPKGHSHKPFGEGACLSCHSPHASRYPNLLKEKGEQLCFECHAQEGSFSKKIMHGPVKKGQCLRCHSPHTSDFDALTNKPGRQLCTTCHSVTSAKAAKAHLGYPFQGTHCMSCHSSHGSDRKGLIKATLHKPFARERCRTCHNGRQSKDPLGLKASDASLCLDCHKTTQKDFEKINSHVGQGIYCVNCHSPHASDQSSLMRHKEAAVCLGCHEDTRQNLDRKDMGVKHPLLKEGRCIACHRAHGSNLALFFSGGEIEVCAGCHERHAKFTHPIGKDAIDPRSKRDITCITCHNVMGSSHQFALRFDRKKQLCIQCHKGY